jgi:hypothetical protein
MHHLLLPVNNFFQSFFQKGVSTPCSSLPIGLSQSRRASARCRLCPKHPPLSNTFFAKSLTFLTFYNNQLYYQALICEKGQPSSQAGQASGLFAYLKDSYGTKCSALVSLCVSVSAVTALSFKRRHTLSSPLQSFSRAVMCLTRQVERSNSAHPAVYLILTK